MRNCKGKGEGQIADFWGKTPQVHLIIIREWPKNNPPPFPPILRNLDNFCLGAFYSMIEKRSKHRLKKEIFVFVKNIVLAKNWFAANDLCEFPKQHTAYGKIIFWPSAFRTKNQI